MPATWDYALEKSPAGYFRTIRIHGYDPSDYQRAEYLWLEGMNGGEWDADTDGDRHPDGMLPVTSDSTPKRAKLMSCGPDLFLVSDAFRRDLESQGFVGLGFHPTKQLKERQSRGVYTYVPHEPSTDRVVWELRPTIELPFMHSELVRAIDGKPVGREERRVASFSNTGFDDVQLVYARSALNLTGRFDIAHCCEWRFGHGHDDPAFPIVVSQRFYQYCLVKKLPARFVPVKIVEGE